MRSLWLDIDLAPKSIYRDALSAAEATARFCQELNLPTPVYVGSGNGLHVYWPLTENLTLEQWLPLARGLKAACQRHGLMAGPERTADAASILRPPGSHHRKAEEREVLVGPLSGPYPPADFVQLAQELGAAASPHVPLPHKTPGPTRGSIAAAAANIYVDEPSNPDLIADGCRQIGWMRETRGCLPEPNWYAAIGVLAFADQGTEVVHEWSDGHPDYNEFDTDKKLDQVRAVGAPVTCRHFESLNPAGCEGCPFRGKITTPLQIGRHRPLEGATQQPTPATGNPFSDMAPPANTPIVLPLGFTFWQGALVFLAEDNQGKSNPEQVCGQEIYLHSIQTGELASGKTSYLFKHRLPRAGWRDVELPAEILHGQGGLAKLAGQGIVISNRELFGRYMVAATRKWHEEQDMTLLYEQCGWKDHDSAFLIGRTLYTAAGEQDVPCSQEITRRAKDIRPRPRGSLIEWSRLANQLFAKGVEAQAFALLASFAAPMLHFFARDEGGVILSLVTQKTGSGKSTAFAGFGSVWSDKGGIDMINGDTAVAKSATLASLCNLPVAYEELTSTDPVKMREFIQTFTTGRERLRGAQDGSILRSAGYWQTIMLTTSNTSLIDTLNAIPGSTAMAARVFEIHPALPEGMKLAGDGLREGLWKNSGFAGPQFMRLLVNPDNLAWVKKHLIPLEHDLAEKAHFDTDHRYWARLLAAMRVAGVILNKAEILEFSPERIVSWGIEQATDAVRTGLGMGIGSLGAQTVAAYANESLHAILVMPRAYKSKDFTNAPLFEPTHRLVGRLEKDTGRLILVEKSFREWLVKQGTGFMETIRALEKQNLLLDRKLVTPGAGTRFAAGQVPCVIVDGSHPAFSGMLREAPPEHGAQQRRA